MSKRKKEEKPVQPGFELLSFREHKQIMMLYGFRMSVIFHTFGEVEKGNNENGWYSRKVANFMLGLTLGMSAQCFMDTIF